MKFRNVSETPVIWLKLRHGLLVSFIGTMQCIKFTVVLGRLFVFRADRVVSLKNTVFSEIVLQTKKRVWSSFEERQVNHFLPDRVIGKSWNETYVVGACCSYKNPTLVSSNSVLDSRTMLSRRWL